MLSPPVSARVSLRSLGCVGEEHVQRIKEHFVFFLGRCLEEHRQQPCIARDGLVKFVVTVTFAVCSGVKVGLRRSVGSRLLKYEATDILTYISAPDLHGDRREMAMATLRRAVARLVINAPDAVPFFLEQCTRRGLQS